MIRKSETALMSKKNKAASKPVASKNSKAGAAAKSKKVQAKAAKTKANATKRAPANKPAAHKGKAAKVVAAKRVIKPIAATAAAAKRKLVQAKGKPAAPIKTATKKPVVSVVAAKSAPANVAAAARTMPFRATPANPAAARSVPAAVAKQSAQRISAPVATKPAPVRVIDPRAQMMAAAAKKPVSTRHGFRINESIVYPAHGVGRIVGIEEQEIAGMALELFVITFEKDKMTLRVPTGKLQSVGMRKLADDSIVKRAMETLKGRARIKRTMWSRRAQEYEAKINSGDPVSIAEVVRDLHRNVGQPDQSFSERQIYEAARDRLACELAAVERTDVDAATEKLEGLLAAA